MDNGLFNEIDLVSSTLFEQYKMYVESAEKISDRRLQSNGFYITVNVAILTIATWMGSFSGKKVILIGVAGILISIVWFFTLRSYKRMNSCKFYIINEIEQKLPLSIYEYEWKKLKEYSGIEQYISFSKVESAIPLLFGITYFVIVFYSVVSLLGGK